MKIEHVVLIVFSILILIVFCFLLFMGDKTEPFRPDVTMDINVPSVTVSDKSTSEFVTITVTRLDSKDVNTTFIVKFPDNKSNFYPVDKDGIRRSEMITRPLKGIGNKDTLQFKIYGTKGEFGGATGYLDFQLWYINGTNQTKIIGQDKSLPVFIQ